MIQVERPALRYYGAKWRLASWILGAFPEHEIYVEPFGGSGALLLRKEPSRIEVYNDLCSDVVNFFKVLRDQPKEIIRSLRITPFSRSELEEAYLPTDEPVERARRFFVRSWQGWSGPRRRQLTGWKFQRQMWENSRADQVTEWAAAKQLWRVAKRLEKVQIENDDALAVIQRFDGPKALFYCDPPYPTDTRNERWCHRGYAFEMTDQDHYHLANLLKKIEGAAIVSTYPNPLYDELYSEWTRLEKRTQTVNKTIATEVLYLSRNINL